MKIAGFILFNVLAVGSNLLVFVIPGPVNDVVRATIGALTGAQ